MIGYIINQQTHEFFWLSVPDQQHLDLNTPPGFVFVESAVEPHIAVVDVAGLTVREKTTQERAAETAALAQSIEDEKQRAVAEIDAALLDMQAGDDTALRALLLKSLTGN